MLNSVAVYLIAYNVQLTISKIMSRQQPIHQLFDIEAPTPQAELHIREPCPLTASRPGVFGDGAHDYSIRDNVNENDASRVARSRKHISDVSTLCSITGDVTDSAGHAPDQLQGQIKDDIQPVSHNLNPTHNPGVSSLASQLGKVPRAIHAWITQNVFLTLSILLFLLVGLPVSFLRQNDLFLDVGFLFTVWLTFTSAQACTKQHISQGNHQHKAALTVIATLLNPVLWTSIFLVVYGLAKAGIRNQLPSGIAASFTTNNTISNIIGHHVKPLNPAVPSRSHIGNIPTGAGDLATSILNAGIVSWGLRLFEYRRQIISRGGLTVIVTSLMASLFNIVAWPLLAYRIGVRPASSDLSFAARSATIALGGPAMKSLGGDAGVNAVGVVINGICFQLVAGLFVGGFHFDGFMGLWRKCKDLLSHDGLVWNGRWTGKSTGDGDSAGPISHPDTGKGRPRATGNVPRRHEDRDGEGEVLYNSNTTLVYEQRAPPPLLSAQAQAQAHAGQDVPLVPINTDRCSSSNNNNTHDDGLEGVGISRPDNGDDTEFHRMPDDIRTVTAGVTIGINAAAMGTAHLYEQDSHAAPYSALSMTTFGVFTVLFTLRSPLTEWLVGMVGGS